MTPPSPIPWREPLTRWLDLDAPYVASEILAVRALRALRENGRRVPEDVAVVGFDDIHTAATLDPPLTTIARVPGHRGVVDLMVDLIERRETKPVVVPTRLVRRECA